MQTLDTPLSSRVSSRPFAAVAPTGYSLRLPAAVAATLALIAALPSVSAQTFFTWNGTNNAWTTGTSWTGGVAQGNTSGTTTENVIFSNNGTSAFAAPNLTSNRSVQSLQFTSSAFAYTFSGNANRFLDVTTGGITNNSTQTQTFTVPVQISQGSHSISSVAGGSLVFNGGYNLTSSGSSQSRTLTIAGAGNTTIASTIANGGNATAGIVNVTSTGTTVFSGNNTYDGRTTLNAAAGTLTLSGDNSGAAGGVTLTTGTLNINNANALGNGTLTLTAGTINNTSGAAVTNLGNQSWALNNGITFGTASSNSTNDLNLGTGVVTASSSRTVTLAGNGSTLTIGRIDNTSTGSGRTFTANGAGNTLAIGGINLSNNSTGAQTLKLEGSANFNITGAITNGTAFDHGLTALNTGIVTLAGNNTYSGLTTVSANSTVKLAHTNALGTTTTGTTVSSGGVLDLNGQTIGAESLTLSGVGIGSAGALINTSATTATLGGAVTLAANTSFGAGNITLANVGESGSRSLTKTGSGTLTLNGTSSYTGGTVLSEGNLVIANGNLADGSFKIEAATTSRASTSVLRLSNVNALASSAILVGSSNGNGTGTLDLAASGNYTLGSYNGNSMKFSASSGNDTTLTFSNNSTVTSGASGARSLTNSDANLSIIFGGTLDISSSDVGTGLTIAGAGDTTVTGAIFSSAGQTRSLTKTGSGTLTLSGDNNYQGNSSFGGTGYILVNGNTTASTGAVKVISDATLGGSGTVGGAVSLSVNGSIGSANSTLTLASTLNVSGNNTLNAFSTVSVTSLTTVSDNGTFTVSGNLTGGALTVASGATLKGGGMVGGNTTIASGAFLTPGNSPASLTVGGNLVVAGTVEIELGGTDFTLNGTEEYDRIKLSGATATLDLTGSTLSVAQWNSFVPVAGDAFGIFQLESGASISSTLGGFAEGATVATIGGVAVKITYLADFGDSGAIVLSGGNDIALYAPIPEPSAYAALAGLGMIGFALKRRRRQQKAAVAA